jgi:hypothetical protein
MNTKRLRPEPRIEPGPELRVTPSYLGRIRTYAHPQHNTLEEITMRFLVKRYEIYLSTRMVESNSEEEARQFVADGGGKSISEDFVCADAPDRYQIVEMKVPVMA